ncbi:MAG: amidohydrolase family protein [Actinomycetota bacterium]
MQSVEASKVLTPGGWLGPSRLVIDDGLITAIEPVDHAPHRILVPGFVDVQVNGVDDVDVARASGGQWERLDQLLLAQGVTSWCPTLVTMPLDRYARPLASIAEAMQRPPSRRPQIVGAHLEGPFLGGAPGAHPTELIVPIDHTFLAELPSHVALVTLGAEQADAVAAIGRLVTDGRLVSIGHTQCSENEFDAAVRAGARLVTHLFNGMSGVHHRSPGVAAFALTNRDVCASIIADGVHVHPRVVRLAFQTLGPDRAVLVTDSVAWRSGHIGSIGVAMRDGAPRLPDGTLAGSAVTMDEAIRVCVGAGVPLEHALRAASTNPARLLGMRDTGQIATGQRADLVTLTDDLAVEQVWVSGQTVHQHR